MPDAAWEQGMLITAATTPRGRRSERTEWAVKHPPLPWCQDTIDPMTDRVHAERVARGTSELIEKHGGSPGLAKAVCRTVTTFTSSWKEPPDA